MMERLQGTYNALRGTLRTLRLIWGNKAARFGLVILLIYIAMAIIGPILLPYKPIIASSANVFQPPRLWPPLYWFGTDNVGVPLIVDIVNGAPFVLEISLLSALYTTVIGLVVGIVAGYRGGYADAALSFISQVLMTIPSLLLVMIIAAFIRTNNPFILAGILSITGWTGLALSVRSQVLAMREYPYIEVSRVLGLSSSYILFKEITPKIMPYIWINFILNMEGAVYAAVGLYFLGLLPYQNYNWGALISLALSYGAYYGGRALPMLVVPVIVVTLYMVALIELAYGIDEVINPRLRR
mgnify:CR=1 FL=1